MFTQNKLPSYEPKKNMSSDGKGSTMDYLYSQTEKLDNPERTIKYCLSILYHDGYFLEAVYANLVEYDGFMEEGCYWYQSDLDILDEEYFEGVRFEVGFDDPDWSVQVSEEVAFKYTKEACLRFLEIHPEHTDFVMNILNNWKPSPANYK